MTEMRRSEENPILIPIADNIMGSRWRIQWLPRQRRE